MTLGEFQQSPTDKVRQPGAETFGQSLLGFESGGEYWLVDLANAGEVLPVPAITDVPLTKPWFCGIANIRGTLYSVTDLAAFHGHGATPIRMQSRLLLVGGRSGTSLGSNLALLMSATLGLKALATLEVISAPAGSASEKPWRGDCYRDSEGRTWTLLLLPVLLGASEFLDIAESAHGT
ncbi:MAG: chemotaxis protein CheW [Georgfuchsia sp.]